MQELGTSALLIRQLRWIAVVALAFGAVTAAILGRELWFPTPPDKLVEVVWTHECRCASGWINTLRREGFSVRDVEMDNLRATRKQWHIPTAAAGCHPARFMGYVLDGHVPTEALRRLADERPAAVGVVETRAKVIGTTAATEMPHFDLIDRDGVRHPWI